MRIEDLVEDFALLLPIVMLVVSIVALVVWFAAGSGGGRGARFAAWLGLVVLTLWCGSIAAFVGIHILLFTLGSTAALVGVAVTTVFMVLMPIGWALVMRHRARSETTPVAPSRTAAH
jgi:hypothetical protein